MLNQTITNASTINLVNINYKRSIDTGVYYYRTLNVCVIDSVQNAMMYSISLIASYDSSKIIKGVSYHLYFTYFNLDKIQLITNGISLSGSTFVFEGDTLNVIPITGRRITIISQ